MAAGRGWNPGPIDSNGKTPTNFSWKQFHPKTGTALQEKLSSITTLAPLCFYVFGLYATSSLKVQGLLTTKDHRPPPTLRLIKHNKITK